MRTRFAYLLSIICVCSILVNCSTTKKTTSAAVGPDKILAAGQKRFPEMTQATFTGGQTIYTTKCARCHGAKEITNWNEEQWKPIMENMAKKAKLTAEEKDQVWKYVVANLDATKK